MQSFKKFLSVFISSMQVLSTCCINLSAADLRPRNHIRALGNDANTPLITNAANGRDVVNIVNPDSEGISHNKYENFDIAKENGVILNNSQENGVSQTGGYVVANPNLSSNARLIINEIFSDKSSSLEGTLEVFGKNADIIIANENGLIINGATFINTNGVTLTTGLIDMGAHQINVKNGNISILQNGVGLDGDYFSVISRTMQLSGNVSKLNGEGVGVVNFIAGKNEVQLDTDISMPKISNSSTSSDQKPQLAIDGNLLGSMYAGYVRFISTEEGVGVRHTGIIKSADDIIITAQGDIQTSALIAKNIEIQTDKKAQNDGMIAVNEKLKIKASSFDNINKPNQEMLNKLGMDLQTSYLQANSLDLDVQNFNNAGKIASNNALLNIGNISNSGKIASQNQLLINFKDTSKALKDVFDNDSGVLESGNILSILTGLVNLDSKSGKIIANGVLSIESSGDISVKNNFVNTGSIRFKAAGDITNENGVLLASQKDIALEAKAFSNQNGSYIFGNNITIKADTINNQEDGVIDSQSQLLLKADTINNNTGIIQSVGDMTISTKILNNNARKIGEIKFIPTLTPGGNWLHYYFEKNYFGNRKFGASYEAYKISNELENKQAVIKSGGNLFVNNGLKTARVYNNNSIIAATKDAYIIGDIYNYTTQEAYVVQDLLRKFRIVRMQATPTFAGNRTTYEIGEGNPLEVLNMAKYSYDDNAGYFAFLKVLASKESLFKSLMAKAFGEDWLLQSDPYKLTLDTTAKVYFTPKNPALIATGNHLNIKKGAIYNSTASSQKVQQDISSIQTKLQNIKDFDPSNLAYPNQNSLQDTPEAQKEVANNKKPTDEKQILKSAGLSEEEILAFTNKLLFQTNDNKLNSKINYYIETRHDLIDLSNFYGSDYFFSQVGYSPEKSISVIGDAYYENKLLNQQLTQNLGYSNSIDNNDIKKFLDNASSEQKRLGLVIGEALTQDQIANLDNDIIWYVNRKIKNQEVLVPQLYFSKNTSFKDTASKKSGIISGGDMFLDTVMLTNQASDLKASGNMLIKASDEVANLGGEISGKQVDFDVKNFVSKSELGIDGFGNLDTINKAKITSENGVNIIAKDNIQIKNSSIASSAKDSKINLIAKNATIEILEDRNKRVDYSQEVGETSNSFWVSTTLAEVSSSAGSDITGGNINIISHKDTTIKGASLKQTSSNGNINIISDGNINISGGSEEINIQNSTRFSGVNPASKMYEYSTSTHTNLTSLKITKTSFEGLGNINIHSKKDLLTQGILLDSDKKINLIAEGNIDILDTQDVLTSSSESLSFQVLGIKGGLQNQTISTSNASSIKGKQGLNIHTKKDLLVVGLQLEGGKVALKSEGKTKIQAGKNTSHQESISYDFGLVGSISAGILGNKAIASFGNNEDKNFAGVQSNFDPKTLSSGKVQMGALASGEIGLEFGLQIQNIDSVHYTNTNIKSTDSDISINSDKSVDIGGLELASAKDVVVRGDSVLSTKYINETTTQTTGISIAIKQKGDVTSSALDAINMIGNIATDAGNGKNLNAGIVATQAIGSATNLIFNDLAGSVSTQELSFELNHHKSYSTSENITNMQAGGKILVQSTGGDIELNGVAFNSNEMILDSVRNISINGAKSTTEESGFGIGGQIRLQESAGYSALWGGNTDIGVGGGLNFSVHDKNETTYQTSVFNIKNHTNITTQKDFEMIGGKINTANADIDIKGNLYIASVVDSKDSKDFNASLGGDIALGVASNTVGKGDFSLNGGGGYYYQNSNDVALQSGISTKEKLNINVGGNAALQGVILDSEAKEGDFSVGGKLDVSDLKIYQNMGGGSANLSGGTSGNIGAQFSIGDFKEQKGILHTAINIKTSANKGISINGVSADFKDLYTNTNKSKIILSDTEFVGGDASFSADVGKIKHFFLQKLKPTHQEESNIIYSAPAEPLVFEPVILHNENLLYAPPPKKPQPQEDPDAITVLDTHSQHSNDDTDNQSVLATFLQPTPSERQKPAQEELSVFQKVKNFFVKKPNKDQVLSGFEMVVSDQGPQDTLPKIIDIEEGKAHDRVEILQDESDIKKISSTIKNLQTPLVGEPSFGNVSLIYGVNEARDTLMDAVSNEEFDKRPLIVNDYVYALNNEDRLNEFSHAFKDPISLPDYIQGIVEYQVSDRQIALKRVNQIPKEDNLTLLIQLATDTETKKIFQNIDDKNSQMGDILNHAFNNGMDGLIIAIEDRDSQMLSGEEKRLYDQYMELKNKTYQDDFFFDKSKNVLDNIISNGGNIYFSLDGIINTISKDGEVGDEIVLENLSKIFDSNDAHYNSITSRELRYVRENYKDNFNIKFFIKDHIIENPFKQIFNDPKPELKKPSAWLKSKKRSNQDFAPSVDKHKEIQPVTVQTHKNLESPLAGEPTFSNLSLVFGVSDKRDILLEGIRDDEGRKRPFFGDDYLYGLNINDSIEQQERFIKFAKSVAKNNPYLLKEEILEYKTPIFEPYDEGTNAIPKKDNEKIFEALIKNPDATKALKAFDANQDEINNIKAEAKNRGFKQLVRFFEGGMFDDFRATPEERRLLNLYVEHMNQEHGNRFFEAKTNEVLKQTLDAGGKIYFNLDDVVVNYKPHTQIIDSVDLERLSDVFDPSFAYYDAITSGELRYVYENYREHPNLKFTIKKQVIPNPFKDPKVLKAIDFEINRAKDRDSLINEFSLHYHEEAQVPNFAPNDPIPPVDRSTKPKQEAQAPTLPPREPITHQIRPSESDRDDTLDFVNRFIESFNDGSLDLKTASELASFGLLSTSSINAKEDYPQIIQKLSKEFYAKLYDHDWGKPYQAELSKIHDTFKDKALQSEVLDYLVSQADLDMVVPLMHQVATLHHKSLEELGLKSKMPKIYTVGEEKSFSFNPVQNSLIAPEKITDMGTNAQTINIFLDSAFHELTHKTQFDLAKNINKQILQVSPEVKDFSEIVRSNFVWYYDPLMDWKENDLANTEKLKLYKSQFIEREANEEAKRLSDEFFKYQAQKPPRKDFSDSSDYDSE